MIKTAKAPKSSAQVATSQLKKIAKRNEATPKGVMAGATKKFVRTLAPDR